MAGKKPDVKNEDQYEALKDKGMSKRLPTLRVLPRKVARTQAKVGTKARRSRGESSNQSARPAAKAVTKLPARVRPKEINAAVDWVVGPWAGQTATAKNARCPRRTG